MTANPSVLVDDVRPLTDREFGLFQRFIETEAGIFLGEVKRELLMGRLRGRVRELGLQSFSSYFELLSGGDPLERQTMLDRISTNETSFFREIHQFEFVERVVLPQWKQRAAEGARDRRVRVWSAGCATGEEPYSIAMLLRDHLTAHEGWQIRILATDLSRRVLDRARAGIWPIQQAEEIPQPYLKRYMRRGIRSRVGEMQAGPEIASLIRFASVNLNDPVYDVYGPFDLILCRNVLIYFSQDARGRAIERLFGQMAKGGLLLLGHAETLHGMREARCVTPTVYVKSGEEHAFAARGRAEK